MGVPQKMARLTNLVAEYALHNALAFDGPKITRDDSRSETQMIRPGPVFRFPKAENCFETAPFKTINQYRGVPLDRPAFRAS